ncbi:MAG: hypothetical protein ABEK16_02275 [Candidatus Nanohalobium sp.]
MGDSEEYDGRTTRSFNSPEQGPLESLVYGLDSPEDIRDELEEYDDDKTTSMSNSPEESPTEAMKMILGKSYDALEGKINDLLP